MTISPEKHSLDKDSQEETDLRERSIKKPKGITVVDQANDEVMVEPIGEATTDVSMGTKENHTGPSMESPSRDTSGRKVVSYRDKLLYVNGYGGDPEDEEEENWIERQKREEEEDGMEEEEVLEVQGNPLCPKYNFSKSRHKEDCKQWNNALIVKLLGKKVNARFLISRLLKLWSFEGNYDLRDIDNGYLVFSSTTTRTIITPFMKDLGWF